MIWWLGNTIEYTAGVLFTINIKQYLVESNLMTTGCVSGLR